MEHYFNGIEGWFTFPKLYSEMVTRYDNAKFAEVGCWKGRSAVFMAVEIINSNKHIHFYCVDTWRGSIEHDLDQKVSHSIMYEEFSKNIQPVKSVISAIKKTSVNAAKEFPDHFFEFVFIDASHEYDDVKRDLAAWYPKVKVGGVFAGHDYNTDWPGVQKAVNEFSFANKLNLITQEECWIIEK